MFVVHSSAETHTSLCFLMNQNNTNQRNTSLNKSWNIMTWNVRGINSAWKWDPIKNKIINVLCDIVCLQETKKDNFDNQFIKKICPGNIDAFEFLPSVGSSGGILMAWNSRLFEGEKVF